MSERAIRVSDSGDLRKYRTEIPNILDDSDLSPYAFRLYVHLKRVAGDTGVCWQGLRTLATACKMSPAGVSNAKKELVAAGFIEVKEGQREKGESDEITIVDVWLQNFQQYAPKSKSVTPVHMVNTPVHEPAQTCSPYEHPCSPGEHKKEPSEERTKKEERTKEVFPANAAKPTPVETFTVLGYLTELAATVAYSHIDPAIEESKVAIWHRRPKNQKRRITKKFLENWCNNIERPLTTETNHDTDGRFESGTGRNSSQVGNQPTASERRAQRIATLRRQAATPVWELGGNLSHH